MASNETDRQGMWPCYKTWIRQNAPERPTWGVIPTEFVQVAFPEYFLRRHFDIVACAFEIRGCNFEMLIFDFEILVTPKIDADWIKEWICRAKEEVYMIVCIVCPTMHGCRWPDPATSRHW